MINAGVSVDIAGVSVAASTPGIGAGTTVASAFTTIDWGQKCYQKCPWRIGGPCGANDSKVGSPRRLSCNVVNCWRGGGKKGCGIAVRGPREGGIGTGLQSGSVDPIRRSLQKIRFCRSGAQPSCLRAMADDALGGVSVQERVPSGGDEIEEIETDVVIVGAGLAGLAAATHLAKAGISFRLVEASDGVGGRVRTDAYKGFLLDRGFQIHITAYPEAQRILDYEELDLKTFYAGASVWFDGKFHRVADPFRHFSDGLVSLTNPIGNVADKILVGIVRFQKALMPWDGIFSADEISIEERLVKSGFSSAMIDRFFRPFFGGIFFDRDLQTTSRLFDFVFKSLALGSNTLPSAGIGAIPQQLAAKLPSSTVLLNCKVVEVTEAGVKLENGRVLKAKKGIVVAVDGPEATKLLTAKLPHTTGTTPAKPPRSTVCIYFSSDQPAPTADPILFLNGTDGGIVNNMFFPTTVAPSYAPPGKSLVSVSLVGTFDDNSDEDLEQRIRAELTRWFGEKIVGSWEYLRTYRIPYAQPNQAPPTDLVKTPRVCEGIYVCGDHRDTATFDGALLSGRRAAQAFMADKVAAT